MNDELFESTKLAAYFLWEQTGCDNALNLWYCAEDIACYLEQCGMLDAQALNGIQKRNVYDEVYIRFVRHLAFRIYIYTNRIDAFANWIASECLLGNAEWVQNITRMALIYRREKANHSVMGEVRSDNVRAFYEEQTFQKY